MDETRGILHGIRVIEVASYIAGPAAATVMADFGADVIKVEAPNGGDPYRLLYRLTALPVCELNYAWLLDGRNKRSLALDLKHEEGREVLLELARGADVFITNHHASVLEGLRLSYADLAPLNPRLVYAHMTGYGAEGPEAEKPGYDATAWWARSGLMDCVRPGDQEPAISTAGMGDHPTSMALFGAILLALYARERTGRGTHVSSSLLANGLWSNGVLTQAMLCGATPFQRIARDRAANALINQYRTRDGRWFLLALVQGDKDWERFCRAVGRPEIASDPRFASNDARRQHARELIGILDGAFAERDFDDWRKRLDDFGVTFGTVTRVEDLRDDPQVRANRMLLPIEGAPVPGLETVDSPIHLRGAPKRPPRAAPEHGEHTREVLSELGYPPARIEALLASGAAGARGAGA
jgi:crotonobetainyl-CoA:carnitine CoA-transferase CaiB-like acyl-CoA transferase